jgi:PleD family two-component response regulator
MSRRIAFDQLPAIFDEYIAGHAKAASWWTLPEADVADLPHILIVDDSRVVRVKLIHHLKDHYDVREESDGEAAWQTLVVDH